MTLAGTLPITNALNYAKTGQEGLAAMAFAGAACWLILTVAIFFPPAG